MYSKSLLLLVTIVLSAHAQQREAGILGGGGFVGSDELVAQTEQLFRRMSHEGGGEILAVSYRGVGMLE